jgi:hypothetical protein
MTLGIAEALLWKIPRQASQSGNEIGTGEMRRGAACKFSEFLPIGFRLSRSGHSALWFHSESCHNGLALGDK